MVGVTNPRCGCSYSISAASFSKWFCKSNSNSIINRFISHFCQQQFWQIWRSVKASINYSREMSCVCLPGSMKEEEIGLSHTWDWVRNIVQEAEVHEWLLSGIEELTRLLWLTNSKYFGARLTHRLNRKIVRTDDTKQDSEEIATAFTVSKVVTACRPRSYESSSWRLLMPLGMLCFAQKY